MLKGTLHKRPCTFHPSGGALQLLPRADRVHSKGWLSILVDCLLPDVSQRGAQGTQDHCLGTLFSTDHPGFLLSRGD